MIFYDYLNQKNKIQAEIEKYFTVKINLFLVYKKVATIGDHHEVSNNSAFQRH